MEHEHPTDEIVADVRERREELLRSAGGSLDKLFATLKDLESRESRPVVKLPPRRTLRAKPDAA